MRFRESNPEKYLPDLSSKLAEVRRRHYAKKQTGTAYSIDCVCAGCCRLRQLSNSSVNGTSLQQDIAEKLSHEEQRDLLIQMLKYLEVKKSYK